MPVIPDNLSVEASALFVACLRVYHHIFVLLPVNRLDGVTMTIGCNLSNLLILRWEIEKMDGQLLA